MFEYKKDQIQELRKLQRSLERIALNISTGSTLESAIKNCAEPLWVNESIAKQWKWIKNSVESGKIESKTAINSFNDLISLRLTCISEYQKNGQSAKIQSRIIFIFSLLSIIFVSWILGSKIFAIQNQIALCLCALGFAALKHIQNKSEKFLWRLEWIMSWVLTQSLVECGMTPAQSLCFSLELHPLSSKIPIELRNKLHELSNALKTGTTSSIENDQNKANPKYDFMDQDVLSHFSKSIETGLPVSKILSKYIAQYKDWVLISIQKNAEASAYLNLIPMYLFFAPAIFISVFGQVIKSFLLIE